jgi:hypothetical protein
MAGLDTKRPPPGLKIEPPQPRRGFPCFKDRLAVQGQTSALAHPAYLADLLPAGADGIDLCLGQRAGV